MYKVYLGLPAWLGLGVAIWFLTDGFLSLGLFAGWCVATIYVDKMIDRAD